MANTRTSETLDNAKLDGTASLFNSGIIRIYNGTQPASPETAISTQTLLVTLTFNATAFGAAAARVATANAITSGSAVATGTAAWARILQSDATTVLMDCSVGTADANLIIDSVSIVINSVVVCTAFTRTSPMQGA